MKIGNFIWSIEKVAEIPSGHNYNLIAGAFNANSFLNCTCKDELIGLMVATGLSEQRQHAAHWIQGKMGGYGNFDKAKKRAYGWYRSKYGLK